MSLHIHSPDRDLAATLRLHAGELALGDELSVGPQGADVVIADDYLRQPPPSLVARALGRLGREEPLHGHLLARTVALRQALRARRRLPPGAGPRFLLRVDDFPRWDLPLEEYLAFHRALGGAPYLVGVTPRLAKNPLDQSDRETRALTGAERTALDRLVAEGAQVALHGLTHRTRATRPHSELAGLTGAEAGALLDEGLAALDRPALGFIPPFNHFAPEHWPALARRFALVAAGGRESPRSFGLFSSPAALDRGLYVPSYAPAYGRARDVRRFVETLIHETSEEVWVPLTLHWAWEREDRFAGVSALVGALRGRLWRWQDLVDEARRSVEIAAAESRRSRGTGRVTHVPLPQETVR